MSYPPRPPGGYRPPPALAPNGRPLAPFSDRFLAYLIDYAIYIGISLLWTVPLVAWWLFTFFSFMQRFGPQCDPVDRAFSPDCDPVPPDADDFLKLYIPMFLLVGASFVLAVLFTYLYWVEYQYRTGGQTYGKRVMKIRVIPVEPAGAGLGRHAYAKRWAVQWLAGMVVPLFNLLDGLSQLWDKPLQQCLHDKAAKSIVVKVG